MPVIFLGGGAGLMKRHVAPEDGLCRTIIMDSVSANAIGYEYAAQTALKRAVP
jgi:plasmid segregation protein ParM